MAVSKTTKQHSKIIYKPARVTRGWQRKNAETIKTVNEPAGPIVEYPDGKDEPFRLSLDDHLLSPPVVLDDGPSPEVIIALYPVVRATTERLLFLEHPSTLAFRRPGRLLEVALVLERSGARGTPAVEVRGGDGGSHRRHR